MTDEYIHKQDVLNLPQSIERNLRGEIVERSINVKYIECLKPADVVPVVHAKWKWSYKLSLRICTNCGYEYDCDYATARKYCPNCGAKMDKAEEDNEQ